MFGESLFSLGKFFSQDLDGFFVIEVLLSELGDGFLFWCEFGGFCLDFISEGLKLVVFDAELISEILVGFFEGVEFSLGLFGLWWSGRLLKGGTSRLQCVDLVGFVDEVLSDFFELKVFLSDKSLFFVDVLIFVGENWKVGVDLVVFGLDSCEVFLDLVIFIFEELIVGVLSVGE